MLEISLGFVLLLFHTAVSGGINWPYRQELDREVRFWMDVLIRYQANQYILHDSENLSVIYRVVTFDSSITEKEREVRLKKIKKEIEQGLKNLARRGKEIYLPEGEKSYLMQVWGDTAGNRIREEAAKRVRIQQGLREQFYSGLRRALAYLPYIRQVFRDAGLPEELAYLPHIESSFNPLARSRVGAAGMWQFMRSTARLYMKVNRIIDQRYDPIISTRAASRLLKYNFRKTGDWGLAITAYNYGLAGILRAMENIGPDYLLVRKSFNHRRFQFASRNFYPEFLAVVEIMRDYKRYFPQAQPAELPAKISCRLKRSITLPALAQVLGVSGAELKKLNPVYTRRAWRGWVRIPAGYRINLPLGKELAGLEHYFYSLTQRGEQTAGDDTAPPSPNPTDESEITARKSFSGTGRVSLTSLSAIRWAKPSVSEESRFSPSRLFPAEDPGISSVLYMDNSAEKIKSDLKNQLEVQGEYIYVFANETLGHYAEWLQIPVNRLRRINGLKRHQKIYSGQKLRLDFSRVPQENFRQKRFNYHWRAIEQFYHSKQIVRLIEYKINAGESLWDVAVSQKIPLQIIHYFNMHCNLNRLYPGDIVRLPIVRNTNSTEETL